MIDQEIAKLQTRYAELLARETPHSLEAFFHMLESFSDIFSLPAVAEFYDEIYYLKANPDVAEVVLGQGSLKSGLEHFVGWGFYEGRAPSESLALELKPNKEFELPPNFDELDYRASFDYAFRFLQAFDRISTRDFAQTMGHRLGHFDKKPDSGRIDSFVPIVFDTGLIREVSNRREHIQLIRMYFDENWYRSTYALDPTEDAFFHYLTRGVKLKLSPNQWFDEEFYLALYGDIDTAIKSGYIASGFEHFLVAGAKEGRKPKYELSSALESFLPGVTKPVGLSNIQLLRSRVEPCAHTVDTNLPPTVWLMLPFLNPDIMFGGFTSFVAFADAALARGLRLGIFLKEAPESSISYFIHRNRKTTLARRIDELPIFSARSTEPFIFGPRDMFVTYSAGEALWAQHFAKKTISKRPLYWIQEYEPIFHKHDYLHFLSNSVYFYEHSAVFNSSCLRDYFIDRQIGRYKSRAAADQHSFSFEHALYSIPPRETANLNRKQVFIYTRPEEHAARNLFEVAIYALIEANRLGAFSGEWDFVGLGALNGPYEVDLGAGRKLKIKPKVSPEEYVNILRNTDVGVSLMYAPHPSLLPYELAQSGAHVATNTFETRNEDYIRRRNPNIVPFEPTIDGCVAAIRECALRAEHGPAHVPFIPQAKWSDVFDDHFFETFFKITQWSAA